MIQCGDLMENNSMQRCKLQRSKNVECDFIVLIYDKTC